MSKILTGLVASLFALSAFATYAPKSDATTVEAKLAAVAAAKDAVTHDDAMTLAKKGGKKKKHPKHA